MISQYSKPEDIDREFWQDHAKAKYWLDKKMSPAQQRWKIYDDACDVENSKRDYWFSEPVFYDSPQTCNHWLLWMTIRMTDGKLQASKRFALYHMTAKFMTMMLPVTTQRIDEKTGEEIGEVGGINIYTAHMFQRMYERLGVDMSDRIRVMRNFAEFVGLGWSDTRPPREGEKHTQIMLRTPASWLRGHLIEVGDHYVTIYRTFYTDRSMTPSQRRDVRTFSKMADEKMSYNK